MWWNKKTDQGTEKAGKIARHGTYFRTATFEQQPLHHDDGSYAHDHVWSEYHEAYQQQDGAFLWTINKIKIENENGETIMKCRPQAENYSFMEALERLAQYESFQKSQYPGQETKDEIATLGFRHFKSFAEREGILWDKEQTPHTLSHPDALPQGQFRASDIDKARAAQAATETLPVPVPGDVLSEIFNDAACKGNVDLALHGLQCTDITRNFVNQLYSMKRELSALCKDPLSRGFSINEKVPKLWSRSSKLSHIKKTETYAGTAKEKIIRPHGEALNHIDQAQVELSKLAQEGKDTSSLTQTLFIFEMATHLLYAQALFNLCKQDPSQAEEEAPFIKAALNDAEQIYTQYLNMGPRDLYNTLKENVTSGAKPVIPDIILNFERDYNEKRARILKPGPRP